MKTLKLTTSILSLLFIALIISVSFFSKSKDFNEHTKAILYIVFLVGILVTWVIRYIGLKGFEEAEIEAKTVYKIHGIPMDKKQAHDYWLKNKQIGIDMFVVIEIDGVFQKRIECRKIFKE